jgi:ribosomal protein S18 acetylase RimI-like enzyme
MALTVRPVDRWYAAQLFDRATRDLTDGTTGFVAGEPLREADVYLSAALDGDDIGLVWFWPFLRAAVEGIARHPVYWYGIVLDPAARGQRVGREITAAAARWLFERHAHVRTIVVAVRASNARSLASLRANPIYEPVGSVRDELGLDIVLAQITRASLEGPIDHEGSEYAMTLRACDAPSSRICDPERST